MWWWQVLVIVPVAGALWGVLFFEPFTRWFARRRERWAGGASTDQPPPARMAALPAGTGTQSVPVPRPGPGPSPGPQQRRTAPSTRPAPGPALNPADPRSGTTLLGLDAMRDYGVAPRHQHAVAAGIVPVQPVPSERVVVSHLDPVTAVPPIFGSGSGASRLPWLLPDEHAAPPGLAADQARLGGLCVRAASVVGAGHRCQRPAVARQDSYRIARDAAGEHLIIAVADGMSDSARAELGASVAAGSAVGLIRRRLDRGARVADLPARELFRDVASAIHNQARERALGPQDVRTTLTVAVIPAQPVAGRRTAWIGYLADTTVWVQHGPGWALVTGHGKDTFDGSTLRTFLPYHPEAAVGRTVVLDAGSVIAVLTDGVADSFEEIDGAAEWFAERWREPPPLASFILDVDFEARAQQDDRTAVVVWCDAARAGA